MAKRLHLLSRRTVISMAERFLIVGGGTMGSGIALVGALAGYDVEIVEPHAAARERGFAFLEREAERLRDASVLERIRWKRRDRTTERRSRSPSKPFPNVSNSSDDVFVALADALSPEALLATNTSSLSVGELADVVSHPERVVGLHFFNPPTRMELLEIVCAPQTSDDALARAYEVAAKIGKTPVLAADTPGFIVNRIARPYYLQALRALERGVASVEELDALARAAGFRMGPFELMDLIGLDVNLATTESIYARTRARAVCAGRAPAAHGRARIARSQDRRRLLRLPRRCAGAFRSDRDVASATSIMRDELVAIVGFGGVADELAERIAGSVTRTSQRIENDDLLDELSPEATIVIDVGDGAADRGEVIAELDSLLGGGVRLLRRRVCDRSRAPARAVCGIPSVWSDTVCSVRSKRSTRSRSSIPKRLPTTRSSSRKSFSRRSAKASSWSTTCRDSFSGAPSARSSTRRSSPLQRRSPSPDDVDTAMRLGANYPIGPIAWGREIGGARVQRIFKRLAEAEGEAFAPHRSLWMLDVEETPAAEEALE